MAMTNMITEIMAEVIKITGIATKELRRGSASEFLISRVGNFTQLRVMQKSSLGNWLEWLSLKTPSISWTD